MKKISSWAAVVAVPTFIASVYGMNFDNMPELHRHYGYPLSLAADGALCDRTLSLFFRRIDWL